MSCLIKFKTILIFIALTTLNLKSQDVFLGHTLHFSPIIKPKSSFNEEEYRKTLYEKYKNKVKNIENFNEYVEAQITYKKELANSNYEYENLDTAVNYIRKIIAQITDNEQLKYTIKIVRNPFYNASADESGTIRINIGLLATLNSEAELAAVLGHELGHLFYDHNYNGYKYNKKYLKNMYFMQTNGAFYTLLSNKNISNKLIDQEEESDNFSIVKLNQSNYNNLAVSKEIEKMMMFENLFKLDADYRSPASLFYLKTHPSSNNRLNKSLKVTPNNKPNFIVDSVYFQKLKRQAIDECINEHFLNQNYHYSNEIAFTQHLNNPDDPFYVFYITESLRRLLIADTNLKTKDYILSTYKNNSFKNNNLTIKNTTLKSVHGYSIVPIKSVNSIMLKLNCDVFNYYSNGINNTGYYCLTNPDTVEFTTNLEALNYFVNYNYQKKFNLNNLFFNYDCNHNMVLTNQEKRFENYKCNRINFKEGCKSDYLYILGNVSSINTKRGAFEQKLNLDYSIPEKINSFFKALDTAKKFTFGNEINYNDYNSIVSAFSFIKAIFKDVDYKKKNIFFNNLNNKEFYFKKETKDFSIKLISPEIYEMAKYYGLKGFVYSDVFVTNEKSGNVLQQTEVETWHLQTYYMNVFENKITVVLDKSLVKYNYDGAFSGVLSSLNSLSPHAANANVEFSELYIQSINKAISN